VVLAVAAFRYWPALTERGQGWALTWVEDASAADARRERATTLDVGQWLETHENRARLAVGAIGQVDLEPGTRVGLVDGGRRVHRLSLARGTMRALIWAPPGQFVVDTPSALAVDLGCQYTLEVTEAGSGALRVEAGWVGFVHHGVRSLVPAGAMAKTAVGKGPGTPHFEDASPAFVEALEAVDRGGPGGVSPSTLEIVLREARARDAFSLWHLLSRLGRDDAGRVFDRLAALVPPPASVTRDGVLRRDEAMLDAWWAELGFGSAATWREWTARWAD
jgi:hypothetical protein